MIRDLRDVDPSPDEEPECAADAVDSSGAAAPDEDEAALENEDFVPPGLEVVGLDAAPPESAPRGVVLEDGDALGDELAGRVAASPEEAAGLLDVAAPLESPEEIKSALEAVLFSMADPVSLRALAEVLDVGVHDVRQAVDDLRFEYVESGRAFRLEDIAGGVQILTQARFNPWLHRLRQKERQGKLSAAALETLSVVAYKQPITKADLEGIRGVACSQILKTLLDRGLVKVVGRDEGLGRPLLYGTTQRFLASFGLESVRDLPEPEDFPRSALPAGEEA